MDQLLQMIQSADPTDNQSDSVELLQLEGKEIHVCSTLMSWSCFFPPWINQHLFIYLSPYCLFDPTRCLQSNGPPHWPEVGGHRQVRCVTWSLRPIGFANLLCMCTGNIQSCRIWTWRWWRLSLYMPSWWMKTLSTPCTPSCRASSTTCNPAAQHNQYRKMHIHDNLYNDILNITSSAALCPQVYSGQPTSGSYAMSGTAVQGYVPMEQLPAPPPIPGQPAPRWD